MDMVEKSFDCIWQQAIVMGSDDEEEVGILLQISEVVLIQFMTLPEVLFYESSSSLHK